MEKPRLPLPSEIGARGGVKEGSESVSLQHQAIIKVNYCSLGVE